MYIYVMNRFTVSGGLHVYSVASVEYSVMLKQNDKSKMTQNDKMTPAVQVKIEQQDH